MSENCPKCETETLDATNFCIKCQEEVTPQSNSEKFFGLATQLLEAIMDGRVYLEADYKGVSANLDGSYDASGCRIIINERQGE